MAIISPSILSANFLNLEKDIEMLNNSQAEWIHIDVMDGKFVPNISFGFPIISAIRPNTKKIFDVHLMLVEPERYIEEFKKVGADVLTIHYESSLHLHRTLQLIKSLDMRSGVAINPSTPVSVLSDIIEMIDVVCIMSVNPGFGGQKFIPKTIHKVKKLKSIIKEWNAKTKIEVDGGVNLENAKQLIDAGADILVAGNTVFSSSNPLKTIELLKKIK